MRHTLCSWTLRGLLTTGLLQRDPIGSHQRNLPLHWHGLLFLVQSIKDALNNGTLTVDVNKIADGVLNTARDLLQQQRPQGN